ncbi:carbohydrate kinase family protein [bacterium]|nr:carbohydrate kinase family protein [bacterium]
MTKHSARRSRAGAVDAIVAGHLCLDVIPAFPETKQSFADLLRPGALVRIGAPVLATGGAVSNVGLALHRLGIRTRLMGMVGNDLFGQAIRAVIRGYAPSLLDGMIVRPGAVSSYTLVISPPGYDRLFLHCPGANDEFGAADIAVDRLAGARLFHFGYPPLMRRMYRGGGRELARIYRRVKQRGLTTALDMALPDPQSEQGRAPWREILGRTLPAVDIFLPSWDETCFMLGRRATEPDGPGLAAVAGELLRLGAAIVVLKLGNQGAYLRTTPDPRRWAAVGAAPPGDTDAWTGRELLAPCYRTKVAGTTGSGDCTIAGFLAGYLRGLGPEACMTAAVAVGACNVEKPDAISGVRPWPAVQRRIRARGARLPLRIKLPGWRWDRGAAIWRGVGDG